MDIAAPLGNFGGQLGKTINNWHRDLLFRCLRYSNTARVGPSVQERQKGKSGYRFT